MKRKFRMIIDLAMTVTLLFLMSYSLIGEANHEILGIVMFSLFIVHHILNRKWICTLFKGKYTSFRKWQTILVALILLAIMTQAVTGIMMSKHVFTFLGIAASVSTARIFHILGAYWGFALMGIHLGFHWNSMLKAMRPGEKAQKILPYFGYAIALYGFYALLKRKIFSYMLLISQFVYFDFSEPLIWFLLDYIAVMGMFVWVGNLIAKSLINQQAKASDDTAN